MLDILVKAALGKMNPSSIGATVVVGIALYFALQSEIAALDDRMDQTNTTIAVMQRDIDHVQAILERLQRRAGIDAYDGGASVATGAH